MIGHIKELTASVIDILTFLNSYKSVALLNDHMPGMLLGNPNGSAGFQYSTNPPSSADITVSYLSLN